jgi:arsenate reductase (thioredoxin)
MVNVLLIVIGIVSSGAQATTAQPPAVIFVCEHGAAKSVIATAYFNKLATERGLPYRATFRGTAPQDDLSVRAVAGLQADGLSIPAGKPSAISDDDIAQATHIFAIGCNLPDKARRSGRADDWSDVPDDRGYGPMRDAIVRHVKELLDRLLAGSPARLRVQRTGPKHHLKSLNTQ